MACTERKELAINRTKLYGTVSQAHLRQSCCQYLDVFVGKCVDLLAFASPTRCWLQFAVSTLLPAAWSIVHESRRTPIYTTAESTSASWIELVYRGCLLSRPAALPGLHRNSAEGMVGRFRQHYRPALCSQCTMNKHLKGQIAF